MRKKRLHVDHPELPLRSRRADRSKLSHYVHIKAPGTDRAGEPTRNCRQDRLYHK